MHYLSFRIAQQWYGVRVDEVIEVLQLVYLNPLPAAADDVLGLMTLRETIVPVIDLRIRFGLPPTQITLTTPIIAIRTATNTLGIVVDDVDDVLEIAPSLHHEDHNSPYVVQVVTLEDRLLMLLDTNRLSQIVDAVTV